MTDVHNQSRYTAGKCKCNVCRADHAFRNGIYRKASLQAARWVRVHHPEVFDALLSEQYELAGVERRPKGRPASVPWNPSAPVRRLRLADIPDDEESAS